MNTILYIARDISIFFIAIIFIAIVAVLLMAITGYIEQKRNMLIKQQETETCKTLLVRASTLKMEIETLDALFVSIDSLITAEISNVLKTYVTLRQPYDYPRMGDDMQTIATEVFNGLKKQYLFNNEHTLVTDDYIIRYIQNQTILIFIKTIQELNEYCNANI